ncbi:MAG: hypothetical protein A2175_01635 [Candidatus Nealsonbacteria bacterium RBG_13_42_11]|uniref:Methyltransferase type 11 domain-containing protein n=1 Tax=Candidatus Nealsonbacteria bacterium RBG_13_42_11 TaxID=1801663 RepID=A0A1G2E104_9BACT|nr:MAG: hypothetical protein A2175_01635 [Candidatus Nealsonbacteria bacterium RBG_13_42_11]
MDKKYAEYLLKKTKEDYNLIAEDFSNTRNFISDDIIMLGKYAKEGDKILDLGCGNGRLNEAFEGKKIEYTGVDNSEKMIEIAKKKYPPKKFLLNTNLNLPFSNDYFDKVYCLAVFHHIPSEEFRLQALNEIKRVLKPSGLLILTVWNLNPFKMILIGKKKRTLSFFKCSILKVLGKSKIDFNDFFIPWKDVCQRYIHYFTKGELKKLAEKSEFKIKKTGISESQKMRESNIYLIAEKRKVPID